MANLNSQLASVNKIVGYAPGDGSCMHWSYLIASGQTPMFDDSPFGLDDANSLHRIQQVQRKIADDAAYERSKRVEAAPLEYLSEVVSRDTIKVLERVHSENQKEEEDRPFWGAVESKRARDAFRDLLTVGTSDPPVYEAAHKELVKIVDAGNICLIVPAGAEEHPLILYLAANNDHRDWDLFLRLKEEGSDLVQGPEQVQAFERGAGRGAWKMLCEAAEAAAERKEARDMGDSEA